MNITGLFVYKNLEIFYLREFQILQMTDSRAVKGSGPGRTEVRPYRTLTYAGRA